LHHIRVLLRLRLIRRPPPGPGRGAESRRIRESAARSTSSVAGNAAAHLAPRFPQKKLPICRFVRHIRPGPALGKTGLHREPHFPLPDMHAAGDIMRKTLLLAVVSLSTTLMASAPADDGLFSPLRLGSTSSSTGKAAS